MSLVFAEDECAVLDSKCPLTNFSSYSLDEAIVFAFAGDHDLSTIPDTEPKILAATDGQPRVVFDLSNANFVDSSMLALLIRRWKVLGGRMGVVVPATCKARRLFSVTGLDAYFNLSETVADACATL
jgi:anti-anti-sigma factor